MFRWGCSDPARIRYIPVTKNGTSRPEKPRKSVPPMSRCIHVYPFVARNHGGIPFSGVCPFYFILFLCTFLVGLACDHGNSFLCLEEEEREEVLDGGHNGFNAKTTTTTTTICYPETSLATNCIWTLYPSVCRSVGLILHLGLGANLSVAATIARSVPHASASAQELRDFSWYLDFSRGYKGHDLLTSSKSIELYLYYQYFRKQALVISLLFAFVYFLLVFRKNLNACKPCNY